MLPDSSIVQTPFLLKRAAKYNTPHWMNQTSFTCVLSLRPGFRNVGKETKKTLRNAESECIIDFL